MLKIYFLKTCSRFALQAKRSKLKLKIKKFYLKAFFLSPNKAITKAMFIL